MRAENRDSKPDAGVGGPHTPASPFKTGLTCTCPACGKGALYHGMLDVRSQCSACGFDLSQADPGDGPAVFVIMVLGAITTVAAIIVEVNLHLPGWAHALIWPVFISVLGLYLLRVFKGILIALQYHHDARPGQLDTEKPEKSEKQKNTTINALAPQLPPKKPTEDAL